MKSKKTKPKNVNNFKPEIKNLWFKGGILIAGLIFAFYFQTFHFDFVNWDDQVNVYENENVVNFDVKGIFSDHVIGNYNPLANFTLAVEYLVVKESPGLYHFNNVLLHIICSLLVYLLMKRLGMSFFASFLAALLFGIHPMRVESVAWITERKDVLFGMFYLISLLLYISYYKTRRAIYFIFSVLVFILSLLSKIQAVALPFSLLLIDYWFERKLTWKSVFEKVPFFLLSLITGLIGIYFLRQQGSLEVGNIMPVFQRLFIGSYSFVVFIVKSIVPFQTSAIYIFPAELSAMHYLSMLPALAVVVVAAIYFKTKRFISFGILFFTLNIVFVLQVVGAGQGFIADRFTYIPYLGLFLIYAVLFEKLLVKFQNRKVLLYSALAVYLLLISIQTLNQIKVWQNSETLWIDVIKKQPTAVLAYNNLAHYYIQQKQPEKALANYNVAIELQPENTQTYNNRGKIFFERGEFDKALLDYNKSLLLEPEYADALANRGAVYGATKQFVKAIEDFTNVMKIDPKNLDVISNRGYVFYQQKEFENAISDCKLYLQFKPKDTEVINLNGLCYAGLNDFDTAILEYSKAIQIEPANGLFYINRSFAFNSKGDKTTALKDAQQALKLGLNVDENYLHYLSEK
jgi:tetratricopeptide (TPR) repeat protein